jgi:predicted tellurium resistance membrane protein TerC
VICTVVKMLTMDETEHIIADAAVRKFQPRRMKVTDELHDRACAARNPCSTTGKPLGCATPFFLALVRTWIVDVDFAVNSGSAIIATPTDTFTLRIPSSFTILDRRTLLRADGALA